MNALARLAARLPGGTKSIRFRLTALYSSVLFAVAAILVGALYLGLSLALRDEQVTSETRFTRVVREPDGGLRPVQTLVLSDVRDLERRVNEHTLQTMRDVSLGALGVLFVASIGVSWLVAGRVLRPIDRITEVARDIQATSLSRRIALEGPDDELKRLADTFDAMLGRIESAFTAQQRFVADASHELRNPLAIIRTNLDVALSDRRATRESLRSQAAVARRASDRMARLVDDLLALARLEAPGFRRREIDLAAVAAEAGDEFLTLAGRRGLRLERSFGRGVDVLGDRDALKRAIANLLDNAVRLAPEGSRIELTAERENGWASVAVRDEGPGIAAEDQERVFDRFWRADGARSRAQGGSGLGLAIVRRIVESHGGRVGLTSDLGAGSRFEIRLPAASALSGNAAPFRAVKSESG